MAIKDLETANNEIAYVYEPITAKDGIRLIILEPSEDQVAPLSLGLLHYSLSQFEDSEVDRYTALSYVWGDSNLTSSVLIDGALLTITASLADALYNMRDKEEAIKVWADGICIDQTNQKEKEAQVAAMGRIYQTASQTVVYLGAEADDSDKVMAEARDSLATRYVGTLNSLALRTLMSRPWFTRTWIYQELLLSRCPRIQAGRSSCSWEEFYTLIDKDAIRPGREPKPGREDNPNTCRSVLSALSLRNSRTYGIVNGAIIKQFRAARQLFHVDEYEREKIRPTPSPKDIPSELNTLLRVLEERRGLSVTDPRDMIYAYLGLTRGSGIEVDYSISSMDLFIFFAKYLLKECGSEALFEHVHKSTHPFWWSSRKKGLDLPSWVPDWTCEAPLSNVRIFLETAVANNMILSNMIDNRSTYRAGHNHHSQLWLSPKTYPEIIVTVGRVLIDIHELEDQHTKIYNQETLRPEQGEGDKKEQEETIPSFLVKLVCSNPGWKLVEFPVNGNLTVLAIPSITAAGDVIALFHGSSRAYVLRPYHLPQDVNDSDSPAVNREEDEIRKEFHTLLQSRGTIDATAFSCTAQQVMHFEIIGGVGVASNDLLIDSNWESVPLNAEENRLLVLH